MNIGIWGCGNVGLKTAAELRDAGHQVYLYDIRRPQQADIFGNKSGLNPAVFQTVNAMAETEVYQAMQTAKKKGITWDAMLVTVGTRHDATPITDFNRYISDFELNTIGCLIPIQAALRNGILSPNARMIVVASTSGHFTSDELSAYCSSKWALENLCSALRAEVRDRNIMVEVL